MSEPKVSVIVPNYNHAPYLRQRLDSILNQSFQDYEVFLLDDCSSDDSLHILREYLPKFRQAQLIPNAKNSGSPFAQWNKGIQLARAPYIWIAESDDFAHPDLLAKLVPLLQAQPKVGLAYAQSMLVDENGQELNSYEKNLRFIYKCDAWQSDFTLSGTVACRDWVIFHNPIPNASGALMRKEALLEIGGADESMRLNGDWMTYAKLLYRWDLTFVADHLNYFRVHAQTQRERARATADVYFELLRINDFLREHIPGVEDNAREALKRIASWWVGSIPYQRKTTENRRKNKELYARFSQVRPRLWFDILYLYGFLGVRYILRKTGILKPVKKWRAQLFPHKYFEH